MSEQVRGLAIATLVEAFRIKPEAMSAAQLRIYEKALQAVPVALLEPMVARTIATRHAYGALPQVHELLEDAEYVRLELMKSNPHEPCAYCEHTPGWTEYKADDVVRYMRCTCWKAHREKLARLGVGHQPLALPEARPIGTEAE